MYTPQPGPPARMYMLVMDKDGVAGVTVWGDTVNQLMGTADIIGMAVNIPGCTMSFYNGKRSLNVPRNHVMLFPDNSPHMDWWSSKLQEEPLNTQQLLALPDQSIANVFAVCASITREEKTMCKILQCNASHIMSFTVTHATANGTIKTLVVWNMVDELGEIAIRDWSGAVYKDSDYTDKTVRIRRVRLTSASNSSVKIAEFLPGANGTKFMISPRHVMMKWWLGDNYNEKQP